MEPGGTAPLASTDHRAEVSLDWVVRLRWGAVAGQLTTIVVAQTVLGAHLPLFRLLSLVAALALSNILLAAMRRRLSSPRGLCGAALSLDTLLLSGLLQASGGAYNPFSVIYLVNITLAAVVLGTRWTWFLAALSVGCYGLLFAAHVPLEHMGHQGGELTIHLEGMWVAFSVAAVLTAYFVVKLSIAIERRDAAMAAMRDRVARNERLASVTTLAAGAAHELGTPLATIAVASRELERSIRALPEAYARPLVEDASLIRSELDRCRAILDRLFASAGQAQGETPVEVRAADLIGDLVAAVPALCRPRLRLADPVVGQPVTVPRNALLQVGQSLLQNAFEAGDGPVTLVVDTAGSCLRLSVRDEGPGMAQEVLSRVGEPFFSTKPPGQGLGLGVFIARTLSGQMGGRLNLESRPGWGTTATVEIPLRPRTGRSVNGQ
ncbi:MAG TPA: ATP-binding protein [Vicinamibacteria bacterium]|nr:ATP-binding protein [Vicinamibacteria bacterium]